MVVDPEISNSGSPSTREAAVRHLWYRGTTPEARSDYATQKKHNIFYELHEVLLRLAGLASIGARSSAVTRDKRK